MLKNILDFFQNEVLGMKWLNRLVGSGLTAAGLDTSGRVGGSIQFFIYDTIKIMVLLGFLILMISYIQSYFPPERTRKILGRFKGIWANIIAALLGTVTPFCSCSSIPLFIGFTSAGLPLGVTFSFLISSPMVDLGSLVLLMSIFGWKVAVVYVVVGLVIAVAGGTLIEKMHLENQVEEFIRKGKSIDVPKEKLTKKDRLKYAWEQVVSTAKKVVLYVLVGVGIGAFIYNWIPENIIVKVLGTGNPFGVIIATIAGVPMYADDFVCLFQYENEARKFYQLLIERLRKYGLEIAEDKSRILPFGRYKGTKENFDFLGFTHYNATSHWGKYCVLHRTSKKKLKMKREAIKKWIWEHMHESIADTIEALNVKLTGHYRYYGIYGNYVGIQKYYKYAFQEL